MNFKVRSYLIELARQKTNQTVGYQKLSNDCNLGLNMQNSPQDRIEMGTILGDISKFEFNNGKRPLLSALVIRIGDKTEGDGFYKLADELGFGKWTDLKKDGLFEIIQIKECIEFWSNNDNYLKYK